MHGTLVFRGFVGSGSAKSDGFGLSLIYGLEVSEDGRSGSYCAAGAKSCSFAPLRARHSLNPWVLN